MRLVAGNCIVGYSGDGGPATSAQLNSPGGIALAPTGNIYLTDTANNVIRKISTDGIISTVAGNATQGFSGDGGPATGAQLNRPFAVAVDSKENVYIADSYNNRVRKVSADGIITTTAGGGSSSGDGGLATSVQLGFVTGIALDSDENLYIADHHTIRKVTPDGIISTVAGSGTDGFSGDGGLAIKAQLSFTTQVVVGSSGDLYFTDAGNNRIRKVSPNGIISTVAGGGSAIPGDGGPATSAQLNDPTWLAIDANGNLYLVEALSTRVRKVSSTGIITTVAGNGTISYSGDGGPATGAQLSFPHAMTVDASNNLYIADTYNACVRQVSSAGVIVTVAGNTTAGYSGDGGPAILAELRRPVGLALDAGGSLYISDEFDHRIRKVTPSGIITTVAGTGTPGWSPDGIPAISAQLWYPQGIALDPAGDLFIADQTSGRIRKVSPDGIITTVAAYLKAPTAVAVDVNGNLYIAEYYNRITRVSAGGIVTTLAGNGSAGYSGDGGAAVNALVDQPGGLAVDASGNVLVADTNNNVIRKISTDGIINTVAGTGSQGYSGDGGPATKAHLYEPVGVTLDAAGHIYIADTGNGAIRLLQSSHPSVAAVTNAASASPSVAAGSLVSIYGVGFAPGESNAVSMPLPTFLGEAAVTFNAIPAPLLYVGPKQINAQVPWELQAKSTATVQVTRGGQSSSLEVQLVPVGDAIFRVSGTNQAIAINNADGSLAAPAGTVPGALAHPAKAGSILVMYGTGFGAVTPTPVTGSNSADLLRTTAETPTVLIGNVPAKVLFSGLSPQFVGVNQINIVIPSNVPTGAAVPLTVFSPRLNQTLDTVTIAVQ